MDSLFIGLGCFLIALALLFGVDIVRHIGRRREPKPTVQGRLRLYDADGKPLLSARLPASGLKRILDDHDAGRLG